MKDTVETFKILADATRLRILRMLALEELTVTELAELLNMPQSRVSGQLQRIKSVFPLCERSQGRRTWLSLPPGVRQEPVFQVFENDVRASRQGKLDEAALARLVARRRAPAKGSGSLGRADLPGRTWEGFARALLTLIPPQRVLDVGVGEGEMTLLLASFAETIHALDPDASCLQRLLAKAEKRSITGVCCHQGSVEAIPLEDQSVDLVVVSQVLHLLNDPEAGIRECVRVLDRGGRLLIMDLLSHNETWVREKLGHQHLGFATRQLVDLLSRAGLEQVDAWRIAKDPKPPRFVSILATGRKGSA